MAGIFPKMFKFAGIQLTKIDYLKKDNMKTQLSKNGPTFSKIVAGTMNWGCWGANFNTQQYLVFIEKCLDIGVTTFDHADIYGFNTTEGEFGKGLKLKSSLREQMQIVTKCGIKLVTPNRPNHKIKSYDTSKKHILWSVENSLKELQTDYLDLLLIHRPSPLMNPDEIAETFQKLKKSGKVLHFGVSNFTPTQFRMLHSRIELVTNQIEASALHLQPFTDGTLDICLEKNIKPMAWSPLGGGGIFTDLESEQIHRVRKVCTDLMERKNAKGIDQILLAWLMKHPSGILPVVGTSKFQRIKDAVQALEIEMTREQWFEILEAGMGEEVA